MTATKVSTCPRCTGVSLATEDPALCGLCTVDVILEERVFGAGIPAELWPIDGLDEFHRAGDPTGEET